MNWVAKWNSCPKKACNSHYIHVLLDRLWKLFMHYWLPFGEYLCAFMQIFMPYWNFEYTKAVTLHLGISGKSGRRYRSWNWGNPFWVKLTSSFFQCGLVAGCSTEMVDSSPSTESMESWAPAPCAESLDFTLSWVTKNVLISWSTYGT